MENYKCNEILFVLGKLIKDKHEIEYKIRFSDNKVEKKEYNEKLHSISKLIVFNQHIYSRNHCMNWDRYLFSTL